MNAEKSLRRIAGNEKQMRLNVPFGIGFNVGDLVVEESVNENEFKVIKVSIVKNRS